MGPANPYSATEGMVTFPKLDEIYDAFQQMVVLFIGFFSRLIYSSHGSGGSESDFRIRAIYNIHPLFLFCGRNNFSQCTWSEMCVTSLVAWTLRRSK